MRITNGILINNSLSNINFNKTAMDKYSTQIATEKKITRPSEDPIVAIRALRFRSTLNEINQYLGRNIPDARSWFELTEDALDSCLGVLSDIYHYCDQAANGTNELNNREAVVETLKKYKAQIFNDANADYSGRRIFTGLKTDSTMTFMKNEPKTSYTITEPFQVEDVKKANKIINTVDVENINSIPVADRPEFSSVNRLRLAYDNLDAGTVPVLNGTDAAGNAVTLPTVTVKSVADPDCYEPGDADVFFIAETGELLIGKDAMEDIRAAENLSITYDKTGFVEGDLKPEHYFECIDKTDPDNTIQYTMTDQSINYFINFNQSLQVNTLGKDVFTHDMVRDVQDIIDAVDTVRQVENKIQLIENRLGQNAYADATSQANLNSMLEAAKKELDHAEENMQKAFEDGIDIFQAHQDVVNLAEASIGSREIRLNLNEARLEDQKLNMEELKSTNEDVDLAEAAILYAAASQVYDASLSSSAKVVKNSLLDFI